MVICNPVVNTRAPPGIIQQRTVSDLISKFNVLLRVDDDLFLAVDRDDLSSTIGITRMID